VGGKMQLCLHYVGVFTFLIVSKIAVANNTGQSLNADCEFEISYPQNSSKVEFNDSCTKAYVLPPATAKTEIANLAGTTNLQFCPRLAEVNEVSKSTFASIKEISGRVEAMIRDFDPLNEDMVLLRKKIVKTRAKLTSARALFDLAKKHLDDLRESVKQELELYEDCLDNNITKPELCNRQKSKIDAAKLEFDSYRKGEFRDLKKDVIKIEEDYTIAYDSLEELQKRYTEAIRPLLELKDELLDLHQNVMGLYKDYGVLEGATGQIFWSTRWSSLVEEFKQKNPNLGVQWSQMPLTEAQFISSMKVPNENITTTLSAITSAIIPGAKISGFGGIGTGEKVDGASLLPSSLNEGGIAFGDSISGEIKLSLVGACPYVDEIEKNNKIDSRRLSAYMTANLIYSYEMAARRGYTARYNLSNLLRKIETKSKRGGFFSTQALHSIAENGYSGDWFSITFDSNASEFQYTPQEQSALTTTIKRELIDKAMAQFAVLNAGQATVPQVPELLGNGAHRSSKELRKCFHHFCQVGSAVLGVMDSIWGNSAATASFHRNNNVWVVDRVSGIQFVKRSSGLSFKPDNDFTR
jgi:hypothetical protein